MLNEDSPSEICIFISQYSFDAGVWDMLSSDRLSHTHQEPSLRNECFIASKIKDLLEFSTLSVPPRKFTPQTKSKRSSASQRAKARE